MTEQLSDWPAHERELTQTEQAAERVRSVISTVRASRDCVDHPPHYTRGGIECIGVIESLGLGFHLGNALKYLWRAGHKIDADATTDLEKARWYLDREIERRRRMAG